MEKIMRKITSVMSIALMALLLNLTGCATTEPDLGGIISLAPSITEILVDMGLGSSIIGADQHSAAVEGVGENIHVFDIMNPDGERIITLMPDLVLAGGAILVGGVNPLDAVSDAGIEVVYITYSESTAAVAEDIMYLAELLSAREEGQRLVEEMNREIESIRNVTDTIAQRKTAYFEISAAPFMFTFGNDVFLQEILEIAGVINIFADQSGWIPVADEVLLALNPEVILTNVFYIEDPITEIRNRPGWHVISAVENNRIYFIDTDTTSRPNHRIVKGIRQIAEAVYPQYFGN